MMVCLKVGVKDQEEKGAEKCMTVHGVAEVFFGFLPYLLYRENEGLA